MSPPKTPAEHTRAELTLSRRGSGENLVSTACPKCGIRFVLLATYYKAQWFLRCANCGWSGDGELKPYG